MSRYPKGCKCTKWAGDGSWRGNINSFESILKEGTAPSGVVIVDIPRLRANGIVVRVMLFMQDTVVDPNTLLQRDEDLPWIFIHPSHRMGTRKSGTGTGRISTNVSWVVYKMFAESVVVEDTARHNVSISQRVIRVYLITLIITLIQ